MFFVLAFIILFLPITIFYPTKVINRKNLPKKKKAIVTSNHYSNLDPIVLDIFLRRKFRFMAKIELFKNKFIGWVLKKMGGFAVDREKITPSTFKTTMNELKKGHQVFIFPEGRRNLSDTEELGDAKAGVITFASKGDAEIVPMLIYHKPKAFRKNYIIVGEPFKVQGENPSRLTKEEVEENLKIYTDKMNALRVELDEYVASKKKKHKK